MTQPSTHPNKAFWEAVALVALLLLILLLSVLHLGGWLGGKNPAESVGVNTARTPTGEPAAAPTRGSSESTRNPPGTPQMPETPAPDSRKGEGRKPTRPGTTESPSADSDDEDDNDHGRKKGLKAMANFGTTKVTLTNLPEEGGRMVGLDLYERHGARFDPVAPHDSTPAGGSVTAMRVNIPSPILRPPPNWPGEKAVEVPVPLSAAPLGNGQTYERWGMESDPRIGLEEKNSSERTDPLDMKSFFESIGVPEPKPPIDPPKVYHAMMSPRHFERPDESHVLPLQKNEKEARPLELEQLEKAQSQLEKDRQAAEERMKGVFLQLGKDWEAKHKELAQRTEAKEKKKIAAEAKRGNSKNEVVQPERTEDEGLGEKTAVGNADRNSTNESTKSSKAKKGAKTTAPKTDDREVESKNKGENSNSGRSDEKGRREKRTDQDTDDKARAKEDKAELLSDIGEQERRRKSKKEQRETQEREQAATKPDTTKVHMSAKDAKKIQERLRQLEKKKEGESSDGTGKMKRTHVKSEGDVEEEEESGDGEGRVQRGRRDAGRVSESSKRRKEGKEKKKKKQRVASNEVSDTEDDEDREVQRRDGDRELRSEHKQTRIKGNKQRLRDYSDYLREAAAMEVDSRGEGIIIRRGTPARQKLVEDTPEVLGQSTDPATIRIQREKMLERAERGTKEELMSHNNVESVQDKNNGQWNRQSYFKEGLKDVQAEKQQGNFDSLKEQMKLTTIEGKPLKRRSKEVPSLEQVMVTEVGSPDVKSQEAASEDSPCPGGFQYETIGGTVNEDKTMNEAKEGDSADPQVDSPEVLREIKAYSPLTPSPIRKRRKDWEQQIEQAQKYKAPEPIDPDPSTSDSERVKNLKAIRKPRAMRPVLMEVGATENPEKLPGRDGKLEAICLNSSLDLKDTAKKPEAVVAENNSATDTVVSAKENPSDGEQLKATLSVKGEAIRPVSKIETPMDAGNTEGTKTIEPKNRNSPPQSHPSEKRRPPSIPLPPSDFSGEKEVYDVHSAAQVALPETPASVTEPRFIPATARQNEVQQNIQTTPYDIFDSEESGGQRDRVGGIDEVVETGAFGTKSKDENSQLQPSAIRAPKPKREDRGSDYRKFQHRDLISPLGPEANPDMVKTQDTIKRKGKPQRSPSIGEEQERSPVEYDGFESPIANRSAAPRQGSLQGSDSEMRSQTNAFSKAQLAEIAPTEQRLRDENQDIKQPTSTTPSGSSRMSAHGGPKVDSVPLIIPNGSNGLAADQTSSQQTSAKGPISAASFDSGFFGSEDGQSPRPADPQNGTGISAAGNRVDPIQEVAGSARPTDSGDPEGTKDAVVPGSQAIKDGVPKRKDSGSDEEAVYHHKSRNTGSKKLSARERKKQKQGRKVQRTSRTEDQTKLDKQREDQKSTDVEGMEPSDPKTGKKRIKPHTGDENQGSGGVRLDTEATVNLPLYNGEGEDGENDLGIQEGSVGGTTSDDLPDGNTNLIGNEGDVGSSSYERSHPTNDPPKPPEPFGDRQKQNGGAEAEHISDTDAFRHEVRGKAEERKDGQNRRKERDRAKRDQQSLTGEKTEHRFPSNASPEEDTSLLRSLYRAPRALLRMSAHVLRNSPVFSLLTIGMTAFWIEGSRQIANLIILSSARTVNPTKRALGADLEFTTSLAQDFLGSKAVDPTALFVLINIFTAACIPVVLLFLHLAVSYADRPSTINDTVEGILLRLSSPILMGAKLRYPWTFFWKARWQTYLRAGLFCIQAIITALLLRQGISFMYLVNNTALSMADDPDLLKSQSKMAEAATNITPGTAFFALVVLLGLSILNLLSGWYNLFNPRSSSSFAQNGSMALMAKLIGSVVIVITFILIMYFFSEISSFTAAADVPTGTYDINLLLANGILMIFTPALAWGLSTIWQVLKKPEGVNC